jgi:hypothetical protein
LKNFVCLKRLKGMEKTEAHRVPRVVLNERRLVVQLGMTRLVHGRNERVLLILDNPFQVNEEMACGERREDSSLPLAKLLARAEPGRDAQR